MSPPTPPAPTSTSSTATSPTPTTPALPTWADQLITLYKSNAANQFVLHGNVEDRLLIPAAGGAQELGSLSDFLLRVMLPRFDVVLSYDVGNGIRVELGNDVFAQWPALKELPQLPRAPRPAIEALTLYFRYVANCARLGQRRLKVGCLLRSAALLSPNAGGALNYDLSALALLIRDWSLDTLLADHGLATFLITENLTELHPLLTGNSRAAQVKVPLPSAADLQLTLDVLAPRAAVALSAYDGRRDQLAGQLAGITVAAVERLLGTAEYEKKSLQPDAIVQLKKQIVERDCNGLIEFIESTRTLADLQGQDALKDWLRQDFALWRKGDTKAAPMGYLLCGPVGCGKTYAVECLAGEAGVPVVKLKNFRDKWVGSSEANLEKIFRLLHGLGRCFVFVDEADQTLGRRDAQAGDGGVSGRLYSMLAEEMSDTRNRGRIAWILASSRPDLIEVDLKRPGRIDVKIPLLPTATPQESIALLLALCRRKGLDVGDAAIDSLVAKAPVHLTAGAAETLATKIYRAVSTRPVSAAAALEQELADYRSPVPPEVIRAQIRLAVAEASDANFVPEAFRAAPADAN